MLEAAFDKFVPHADLSR